MNERSRVNRKLRRIGMVNAKLIGVLALVLIAGAAFWGYKLHSSKAPPVQTREVYELWCSKCKAVHKFPGEFPLSEATGRPRDDNGRVLCPKCNTYSGNWGGPRQVGGAVAP